MDSPPTGSLSCYCTVDTVRLPAPAFSPSREAAASPCTDYVKATHEPALPRPCLGTRPDECRPVDGAAGAHRFWATLALHVLLDGSTPARRRSTRSHRPQVGATAAGRLHPRLSCVRGRAACSCTSRLPRDRQRRRAGHEAAATRVAAAEEGVSEGGGAEEAERGAGAEGEALVEDGVGVATPE